MGVIKCELHGKSKVVFVSERLQEFIKHKKVINSVLKFEIIDKEGINMIFFMEEGNKYSNISVSNFKLKITEEFLKSTPICHSCFLDFIEAIGNKVEHKIIE